MSFFELQKRICMCYDATRNRIVNGKLFKKTPITRRKYGIINTRAVSFSFLPFRRPRQKRKGAYQTIKFKGPD